MDALHALDCLRTLGIPQIKRPHRPIFPVFDDGDFRRTKEALAAAKRRGVDIGATGRVLASHHKTAALERAKGYGPLLDELRANGVTQVRQVRDELNRRGVVSPGGGRWHLRNTHNTILRNRY